MHTPKLLLTSFLLRILSSEVKGLLTCHASHKLKFFRFSVNIFKKSIPVFCVCLQVRYTQLVRQRRRKPPGCGIGGAWRGAGSVPESRFSARGGSRRSGYAFAHQEGFGELITSGKNMRLSSLGLASFASRHSSSWIETLRRKKNTHTPPSTSENCSPAPSHASGTVPPLSNSSSVLGGSQEAPIEEETVTEAGQNIRAVPASLTQPAASGLAQASPAENIPSASVRSDLPGGWRLSFGAVQVSSLSLNHFYKCALHLFYLHGFKRALISLLALSDRKLCLDGRLLQLVLLRPANRAVHVLPWKPARLSKTDAKGRRIPCLQPDFSTRAHCGERLSRARRQQRGSLLPK